MFRQKEISIEALSQNDWNAIFKRPPDFDFRVNMPGATDELLKEKAKAICAALKTKYQNSPLPS